MVRRPPLAALAWALVLGAVWGASGEAALGPLVWGSAAFVGAVSWLRCTSGAARLVAVMTAVFLGAAIGAESNSATRLGPLDDGVTQVVDGRVDGQVVSTPFGDSFLLDHRGEPVWVTIRGAPRSEIEPGDRIVVTGELRGVHGYRVWGARDRRRAVTGGASVEMTVSSSAVFVVSRKLGLRSAAHRTRRELARAIDSAAGGDDAKAVLRAMVLGDRSALDERLAGPFRAVGLSHVLAVSGLHVAAVATTVFFLLRFLFVVLAHLGSGHRMAAMATIPTVVFYALLTGARPSTVRATVVVVVFLVGLALSRRARVFDALAVAAALLVAVSPTTAFDPSFQLSFAAAAALVLCPAWHAPPSTSAVRRVLAWARALALASLWATIATLPLSASWFGSAAPLAPVVNPVAVPLAELVVVPFGLFGLLVHGIWPVGGAVILELPLLACELLTDLARYSEAIYPALDVRRLSPVIAVCMTLTILLALAAVSGKVARTRAARAFAVIVLVVISIVGWRHVEQSSGELVVTFVDVGQGDAAIVEFPDGAVWLIDGGGRPYVKSRVNDNELELRRRGALPGERAVRRFLDHRGIEKIDVVVVSHAHPDHFLGVHALIESIPIEYLWLAGGTRWPGGSLSGLLSRLESSGTTIVTPALGLRYYKGAASVEAVWPIYGAGVMATADPVLSVNDNSLAVVVSFAGRRVLFGGDLEGEGEELLAAHSADKLAADVVKVPHHGSATSSTPVFVGATKPALAVISCGVGNRFRFPADAVVERWRAAGATVLRTDESGSIQVRIAPNGAVEVETYQQIPARAR